MKITNYIDEKFLKINNNISDKESLLKEIATQVIKNSNYKHLNEKDVYNGLIQREKIGSTGFENGIAIPHCRLKNIDTFCVGIIVVPKGIDFNSADKLPSNIFFYIIAPEEKSNEHITLLSLISKSLRMIGTRDKILNAGSALELKNIFDEAESEINDEDKLQRCLITVFVQNEDVFLDVLQIFSTLELTVSVMNSEKASDYLHSIPLFATFWNSEEDKFNKVIFGAVKKNLVNEALREINGIIDSLENKTGVMAVVQDITYFTGKLMP
ncbi:PTS sugar transporter subunit IIA [bacterium]|nr:PTS sugar transporter subunit IIA [bacterium]